MNAIVIAVAFCILTPVLSLKIECKKQVKQIEDEGDSCTMRGNQTLTGYCYKNNIKTLAKSAYMCVICDPWEGVWIHDPDHGPCKTYSYNSTEEAKPCTLSYTFNTTGKCVWEAGFNWYSCKNKNLIKPMDTNCNRTVPLPHSIRIPNKAACFSHSFKLVLILLCMKHVFDLYFFEVI